MDRHADLALIGNCQVAAHVARSGAIVWCCLPRFDAPPVFGRLLDDDGGDFLIGPADGGGGTQHYQPNTNILETRFERADGAFRVIDFAPRFIEHGRQFRPRKLVRIVEPITGTPRLRVRCDPIDGWSRRRPRREEGSHHVTWHGYPAELRLTTDAPLAYLATDRPFALTRRLHFVLSWGAPVEEPLEPLVDRFLVETRRYWHHWVKQCEIPGAYQESVIRSALALKLHCYEDTGAIVAALTTSLPESPNAGRTWDYRYCWLRDASFVLDAFRLLGHYEEREQFLHFLLDVAASAPDLDLAPLYRIDGGQDLDESILSHWRGHGGDGPVRVGNAAASHRQWDVYGELVIALAPLLLDARFREHATPTVLDIVARLARRALRVAGQPDAGIWEYRADWRPQTFSTMMCWAAADRMARIADTWLPDEASSFRTGADALRQRILTESVDPVRGCLVADHGGTSLDAALLQAVPLRFLPADDPRLVATVRTVQSELAVDGWLRRYRHDDGFGEPQVAFLLCSFWLVEALTRIGARGEARELMDRLVAVASPTGLLAENVQPSSLTLWGNYPQAYSHVGLIRAAFAVAHEPDGLSGG